MNATVVPRASSTAKSRAATAATQVGAQHAPVEDGRGRHRGGKPEQALGVHERRRVGPERVIEPMGQNRHGLEELCLQRRIGPPGEGPDVHDPTGTHRVASEEPKHLGGRPEQVAIGRRRAQDLAVIEIIEDQARPQGRQTEKDAQRRHGERE